MKIRPALILTLLLLIIGSAHASDAKVYNKVMAEFGKHENRLPGTDGYYKSIDALESALKEAGLSPQRQTYNTLSPVTKKCSLKVDGKEIGSVFPLGPNGVSPTTTGGSEITGHLVYLGGGTLDEMNGKKVEGSIAMLDMSSSRMAQVFSQGAKAVIFIGDEKATQWQVSEHFTILPASIPRLYMSRETATKNNLFAKAESAALVSLDIATNWKDSEGVNLWLQIPGAAGKEFGMGAEEAIILSTTLDTFGVVPDLCPGQREAANVALLAQIAANLSESKPDRSIVIAFFGSHYNSQDGARHFFWAVNKANTDSSNRDPLDMRLGFYKEELGELNQRLDLLQNPDLLASDNGVLTKILQEMRRKLDTWSNEINFSLRQIAIKQLEEGLNKDPETIREFYRLKREKRIWNEMKRQLILKEIDKPQPLIDINYVNDWPALCVNLYKGNEKDASELEQRTWKALTGAARDTIESAVKEIHKAGKDKATPITEEQQQEILDALNAIVDVKSNFSKQEDFATAKTNYNTDRLVDNFTRLSSSETEFLNRLLLDTVLDGTVIGCIDYQPHFRLLVKAVSEDLNTRKSEVETFIRHNAAHTTLAEAMITPKGVKKIVGHYNLDFANDKDKWIPAVTSDTGVVLNKAASLGVCLKNLSAMSDIYQSSVGENVDNGIFLPALKGTYKPVSLAIPGHKMFPISISNGIGCFSYNFMTTGDPLNRDELPVRGQYSLNGLAGQLTQFFTGLAKDERISMKCPFLPQSIKNDTVFVRENGKSRGYMFHNIAKGSIESEGTAWHGIGVYFNPGRDTMAKPAAGQTRLTFSRIYGDGCTFAPLVCNPIWGDYYFAVHYDEKGELDRISDSAKRNRLFFAKGGAFFRPINQLGYDIPKPAKILNAKNNSTFKMSMNMRSVDLSVFYLDKHLNYKYIGNGLTILGSIDENPKGLGVELDPVEMISSNTNLQSSLDYKILNKERLDALIKRNIRNQSIQKLWTEAEEHSINASEERKVKATGPAAANEFYSMALGQRAYTPLHNAANDMVQAVIILMILSIPFAFAMERLLLGFTTIYKQIGGFTFMFLSTFGILYFFHPAFSLADAPTMIFLAFVIILLSGLVIFIVMSKFRHEIKAMQGLVSKVHSAQSEGSTALASILIGISGMRNRPLKTMLTAATIVLLTFTILVFSSFSSREGVFKTYIGQGSGLDRIEIHRPSFLSIPGMFTESCEIINRDSYEVYHRNAMYNDPLSRKFASSSPITIIALNPKSGKTLGLKAMLGIQPGELKHNKALEKILPGMGKFAIVESQDKAGKNTANALPPIYLSEIAAKTLSLSKGDKVLILGKAYAYADNFDNSLLQNYSNLDDTKLLPPDYDATLKENDISSGSNNEMLAESLENIDTSSFVWTPTDQTAITTFEALQEEDSLHNFMTLYPKGNADIDKTAHSIAQVFIGPIFSKSPAGAEQFFFTRALEGSGMSEIVVPLILGGLIIFSSLLGSIVDREKEIFTYSALGLAPPDVAALFFAESSVYAVLGGMGGYLFSQLIAKLLTFLASLNLFTAPEMNFSALSSIYTILLVMATVILSTIYPALKAGKSANPGVARKWKMPAPDGNLMKFIFPFTVSASDLAGVLSFIREHFEAHSDASLGTFASRDVRLFKQASNTGGDESLGIMATLSLAPFDLGVFQHFRLYSKSSDIEGIEEVVIELERVSGPPGAWIRANRKFIDELRNQFLLWRSLPIETIEHYRELTAKTLTEDTNVIDQGNTDGES
ncbi:MAG: hypothetical protein JXR97_15535 [Planctomycetes bacterium]|nr:hypothetical protein [Planctomycetota bacterium]